MPLLALSRGGLSIARAVAEAAPLPPSVTAQTVSIPDFTPFNFRILKLQTTAGTPGGVASPIFVLGGTDASSFTVTDEGVVALQFSANRATKSSYTFTAAAKNAAGIGPAATINVGIVAFASVLIMEVLATRNVPANAPGGTQISSVPTSGVSSLSSCTIAASTHPGKFSTTASGGLFVAAGQTLPPQGEMVVLTIGVVSGALSDTEDLRVVIEAPEAPPVITATTRAITTGTANRVLTNIPATGVVRSDRLVAQSHANAFSLLTPLTLMTNIAITVGAGPYWIDVEASNYGGPSPIQRVDLPITAGPGAYNALLPEDTTGPVAGTPSLT
jgi:hypothetical protein